MKKLILTAAVSLAALFAAPAMADSFGMRVANDGVSIGIGIGTPPPAPMEYMPPQPQPGVVWAPGYWTWNGYRYVWMQGRWVAAPPPAYVWGPRHYWGFGAEHRHHEEERHERHEEERHEHRGQGGWRDR